VSRLSPEREAQIRELLAAGYSNAAISRRTGADWSTAARLREVTGVGPPTVVVKRRRRYPKEAQIRRLLEAGLSDTDVARRSGADRHAVTGVRARAGIAPYEKPLEFATADAKRRAHLRPVEGGHVEWTGERSTGVGTPLLKWQGRSLSPAAMAFEERTGRAPVGMVFAECGFRQCVAPEHVDDEPGRQKVREQLRMLLGMGERPERCSAGHDQAVYGRLQRNAVHYCARCKVPRAQHRKALPDP
jgi:hypothetical protein